MRRIIPLMALVALMSGSCSSSEPLGFDLAQPMEPPEVDVTISGEAVSEGMVCEGGRFVDYRMEDMDGKPLDLEAWSAMFDAAVESRSVVEARSINDYECSDGSGTITVDQHLRFDFGEIELEDFGQGSLTSGTWTVDGTGDYEVLSGSGDIVNNFDTEVIHMIGEVES